MKNVISCFKVEAKKINIESERPSRSKKKEIQNNVENDDPLKRKTTEKTEVKSTNSITNDSNKFAIYEKRKMIEPVRKELLKRGWTEISVEDSLELPKFVWLSRSNAAVIKGSPIVNRLKQQPFKNFCFKDILVNYGRVNQNSKKNKLDMPRTFKLFENERNEFMNDYRLTAYSSFVRFLHATGSKAFSETGRINSNWIKVAIEKLEVAIASSNHKQSETSVESTTVKQQKSFNEFVKFKKIYQSVVKYNSKIKANSTDTKNLLEQCDVIYGKCEAAWKDFHKDGFYNLWLLKPARRSLGVGIKLFDDDLDILSYARDNEDMKYLAQKYVGEFKLITHVESTHDTFSFTLQNDQCLSTIQSLICVNTF